MTSRSDTAFIRQFSAVIAAFMVLTVALIFLARYIQPPPSATANPSRLILAEQRIQPVAGVRAGETGAAELAAAEEAAAAAAPAQEIIVDGPTVYNSICMTCHDAGVAGAPIKASEQMATRLEEKGLEMLISNAINGINAMPARGGNPALTDEQIKVAVEFMLP